MRRLGFTLALLVLVGLAAYGEGLFDRQHLAPYVFYRTEGTVIDSTDSKVFACATYHSDTTGNTVEATPTGTGTMTAWYWTNITWDIYDVYWDSAGTAELVADNILILGRVLGDSTITDTLVFGADCVPGYAIIDDAILTAHIDDDQLTKDHYSAGSVDSTAIGSAEIGNAHMDMSEQFNFMRLDVDTIGVTDSAATRVIAAAFDSIYFPADAITGDGLNVSSGKIDIDVAPSSGYATLIEEEDALQVKFYSATFEENMTHGLTIKTDGISMALLDDGNTPAADDFAVYDGSDIEWKTHAEATLAKIIGTGYAEMPDGAVDTLMIYLSGAATSDDCLCSFSGRPAWVTGLEMYVASVGCSVTVADSIKVWRSPDGDKTFGEGELTFFWLLLRNP